MPPRPKQPADHKPARKTAARRNRSVQIDLDAVEREGDILPPFTFQLGGKSFTLADPSEIELNDIVEISGNPGGDPMLVRQLLGEQYAEVVDAGKLPQWKVVKLFRAWLDYYGLNDPGKFAA